MPLFKPYQALAHSFRVRLAMLASMICFSLATGGVALVTGIGRPWAVTAFLAALIVWCGWNHLRKWNNSVQRLEQNPQLVYWAFPTNSHGSPPTSDDIFYGCTMLFLYLRDGTAGTVVLSTAQMRAFIAWLRERNPAMRWGQCPAQDDILPTNPRDVDADHQAIDVCRMVIDHRIARWLVISTILWYASVALLVCSMIAGLPGIVPALIVLLIFTLHMVIVRDRNNQACRIAENPQLVDWVHPLSGHQLMSGSFVSDAIDDCTSLLLHLRDGTTFKAELPASQMRVYVAWLAQRNPSVQWGGYDNLPADPVLTT
jgi:hypothetical protein